jgi:GNAT superfamily N-acetyltransferase
MQNHNVVVLPTKTKRDLLEFIKFPWQVYKGDPNWVPPLLVERKEFFDKKKNPFFQHADVVFFLARRNGKTVGRIAGIVNYKHIETHQEKVGFFGFFEFIQDYEVAKLLLDTVREWLRSKGMEIMRGPANYSSNEEWGFLTEGSDSPPVIMMTYNPPYYPEYMETYGMVKAKDLYAYYIDKNRLPPERVNKMAELIKKRENITIRAINMKDFQGEVARIKQIYNAAWSKNWGFIPMTDEEFNHLAKSLKQVIDPHLVFIAEVEGKPAGFALALPDVNQALIKLNGRLFPWGILKLLWHTKIRNKINGVRIITMGVVHEFQKRGIDTVFYVEIFRVGIKRGYTWAEMSWVLEDNVLMNRVLELLGATLYKKYRLYEIPI